MLYFDRIDVSKTSELNGCDVCNYWYVSNKGFIFQPNISNGYHDLLMMSMNLSNIAVLNIKGSD